MVTVLNKCLCESIGSSDRCFGPAYSKQDTLRSADWEDSEHRYDLSIGRRSVRVGTNFCR